MDRKLLLGGAALIGVLVATLLFRSPSTGGAIPDVNPAVVASHEVAPTPTRRPEPEVAVARADGDEADEAPTRREPVASADRHRQTDATRVGMQLATWTQINNDIARIDDPESDVVMDEVSDLRRSLRDAQSSLDAADLPALQAQQNALRDRIRRAGLATDAIDEQFKHLDDLVERYPLGEPGQRPD